MRIISYIRDGIKTHEDDELCHSAFVTRWNNIPAIVFNSFKTKVESILA